MASVRPIPTSYYYSGQGRLGLGDRNTTTGKLSGLIFVGNVTSVKIDIATTKFDHKESMSGNRAVDLTIVQEKNATFDFVSDSLGLDLLANGLYGGKATTAGATATGETHFAELGKAIVLDHPNVTSITTITTVTGTVALVEGTDYTIDKGFGTIYIDAGSTVVDVGGENIIITYVHGVYDRLEAFTTGTPPEKWIHFEGLNTVTGDLRSIDIFRGAFEPLTGLEFINADLGSGEFKGSVLLDPTITTTGLSQFFRERRVYA